METKKKKGTSPIESIKLLFSANYRRITIMLSIIWFINALAYYGVVVMTPSFFRSGASSDSAVYIETFITSAAEFPGVIAAVFLINSIGRKKTQGWMFLICGFALFLLIIPTARWLLTIFAVVARLCIMGAFSTTFVFTPEVFPTVVRSTGLGFCAAVSRLAGVITPFVGTSLLKLRVWAPLIIYGSFCVIGALLTFTRKFCVFRLTTSSCGNSR
jgi:putative MFS transporter